MNDIITTSLLAGDKCIPEMHLKQPKYTYSARRPFTKNKERTQKFKETGHSRYIYTNEIQPFRKIVRLAPPAPLFNVGCKFASSFLATTA